MAIDVYLKLDGIKGESTQKGHEGEIQLLSASVGVSDRAPVATGAGAGKAQFQDLHVTKTIDSASPQLFLACSSGKHIATGTITIPPAGGSGPHLTVALTDVLVTSYELSVNPQAPSETVTFAFGSLKLSYQTQNDKGILSSPVDGGWDITKNKAV